MTPADLVAELRARGVVVTVRDGRIGLQPKRLLTPELLARVAAEREPVLAWLTAQREADIERLFGPTVIVTEAVLGASQGAVCYPCEERHA